MPESKPHVDMGALVAGAVVAFLLSTLGNIGIKRAFIGDAVIVINYCL